MAQQGARRAGQAENQRVFLEQEHHSSLFDTLLCSYFFFYNERGKNTFVISWWGETIVLLELSPPRRG